jgi:hypothetical protein
MAMPAAKYNLLFAHTQAPPQKSKVLSAIEQCSRLEGAKFLMALGEKMKNIQEMLFDPETIGILKSVLEDSWACLIPHQQRVLLKTQLAERILAAAAEGEGDPGRLRARAMVAPAGPRMSS